MRSDDPQRVDSEYTLPRVPITHWSARDRSARQTESGGGFGFCGGFPRWRVLRVQNEVTLPVRGRTFETRNPGRFRVSSLAQGRHKDQRILSISAVLASIRSDTVSASSRAAGILWANRCLVTERAMKAGRNDPCPCGSGKKYKKCCLANDLAAPAEQLTAASPPLAIG